jgi:hypothetical protein
MRLFREIVLNVWNARRSDAGRVQDRLQSRISELERRESLLETAFLYDAKIDRDTYTRQRDGIREALTLAKIELEDARCEDLDVEGLLRFSEDVLCNAARLWRDAPIEDKLRIQAALFPSGLRMRDGTFGTVVTSFAFNYFGGNSGGNSGLASPTGSRLVVSGPCRLPRAA